MRVNSINMYLNKQTCLRATINRKRYKIKCRFEIKILKIIDFNDIYFLTYFNFNINLIFNTIKEFNVETQYG